MNYAHDGKFSAKKAGGLGLTFALHALLAVGVIYSLHRTFVHPAHPPVIPVTPLPEAPHPVEPVKHTIDEPTHTMVTIPILPPPPVDTKKETPSDPTLPHITSENPVTDGPIGKPGGNAEGGVGGGENKAGAPVSSPVITNLNNCKPAYPRSSIMNEESGTVRVRFEIGADSKLIAASVLHSSGHTALDKAAVNALSQCQFKAAQQDGVPVSSSLVTDYVWKLDNE